MGEPAIVHVYHAVDAEGPLYESLEAKFERLHDLYAITHVPPSWENFRKLQRAEIDLGGLESQVAQTLSSHLVAYNDTWDKIDAMLERVMSAEFRHRLRDSFGGGWVYNWHCMDHVGYENNPRRRDMGYHNIFDHYRAVVARQGDCPDGIHWHFHPMSTYRDAHLCATSYVNSSELYQVLCRRIIERRWFPTVFRAGFQTERPDSHWFLEQWIPFDISNLALDDSSELERAIDLRRGRAGDWRFATSDWAPYHPDHDNYQQPGNCRRWIARALNVLNRFASVDQRQMDKAFAAARAGKPTIVGVAGHDFRELGDDVDHVRELLANSSRKFPGVRFKFCEGIDAFRSALWPEGIQQPSLELDIEYHPATADDVPSIEVVTRRGKVFGPQPFLAIQTKSRRFIHDNFDFDQSGTRWSYAFHSNTLPLDDVEAIGVAANDAVGHGVVVHADLRKLRGY